MLGQGGQELLRLVQVRAVAGIGDDHLAVSPARGRVPVQHRAGLGQHGLRRPGLLSGPARHRPERAQVGQVVQRGVGHDHVVGAAQPQDRRLGPHPGQVLDPEVRRGHGVQHAVVARRDPRPRRHRARVARVVMVADPGGQHGLHEDVQVLRHERRLHVVRQQHLAR